MSHQVQWREHITTEQLVLKFDMTEGASILLALHRLRWLGHVGKINDDRLPKQILFGELLSDYSMGQNLDGEIWCSIT